MRSWGSVDNDELSEILARLRVTMEGLEVQTPKKAKRPRKPRVSKKLIEAVTKIVMEETKVDKK
jgi:hypothetical protein